MSEIKNKLTLFPDGEGSVAFKLTLCASSRGCVSILMGNVWPNICSSSESFISWHPSWLNFRVSSNTREFNSAFRAVKFATSNLSKLSEALNLDSWFNNSSFVAASALFDSFKFYKIQKW